MGVIVLFRALGLRAVVPEVPEMEMIEQPRGL